ncbi:unnamed protein product, partial [Polarella glacialis]
DCNCAWKEPLLDLVDVGTDINGVSWGGYSPLVYATSFRCDVRVLETLLSLRADPIKSTNHSWTPDRVWTPLHEAARLGRADCCEALLEAASKSSTCKFGSESKDNEDGEEDAEQGPEEADDDDEESTPSAAKLTEQPALGHSQVGSGQELARLLESRCKERNGSTALAEAATMNHIRVAKVLLGYGANINARLDDGSTVLMVAASK